MGFFEFLGMLFPNASTGSTKSADFVYDSQWQWESGQNELLTKGYKIERVEKGFGYEHYVADRPSDKKFIIVNNVF